MNFAERLAVVSVALFACASLIATALIPALLRRCAPATPGARASRLFRFRILSTAAGTAALLLTALSFIEFEERTDAEPIGKLFFALAAVGAVFLVTALIRLVSAEIVTAATRRRWLARAQSITLPHTTIPAYAVESRFPLVAVVGVFRPVLVIAQSVLKNCSADELAAIVAHEEGHVRRRDNLRRAIIAAMPDALRWLPVARRLDAAWDEATEQAADDAAARVGPGGRLYLANALIRVARLVPAGLGMAEVPASALFRGEALERRISRLLDPATSVAADDRPVGRLQVLAAVTFVVASLLALEAVHELLEIAVKYLP